jgi:hypothetical protein
MRFAEQPHTTRLSSLHADDGFFNLGSGYCPWMIIYTGIYALETTCTHRARRVITQRARDTVVVPAASQASATRFAVVKQLEEAAATR